LVDVEKAQHWDSRRHFFAAAAEAMRKILVDRARRKGRLKRGGDLRRQELDDGLIAAAGIHDDLLQLDAALEELEKRDARKAQVVKLRYFAGLTVEEAAAALGVSPSTVDRDWTYARAWLFRKMTGTS
jgi:RNA polymerase sigma factor (TIGR02999 family)